MLVRYKGFNYLRHDDGVSMFENGLELSGGFARNSGKDHCILDFTKYTFPDEAYSLFLESLSVILEVHGDAGVLEEIGVRVLADLDRALRDARVSRGDSLARRLYDIPHLMEGYRRKVLASYYTDQIGVKVISTLAKNYVLESGLKDVVVVDPFMGSGVLLAGFIREFGCEKIKRVIGFEKDPLSCIVGYALLLRLCGKGKVEVRCGDTFKIVQLQPTLTSTATSYKSYAHLILTNSPFTRWELLNVEYKRFLEDKFASSGYSRYITRGQLNLQTLSLFLADYMLKDGGLLASVLPASTFYTIYGEGVKKLLRENYHVLALIQKRGEPSFSVGSGFKEVILVASKSRRVGETAFITLDNGVEPTRLEYSLGRVRAPETHYVDLHRITGILDFNWLALFKIEALRQFIDMLSTLLTAKKLLPFAEALGKKSIVRGVEMYGPDFFLIPNRFWHVLDVRENYLVVSNGVETLELPKGYLIPALRRPGLYMDAILVKPDHYLVSIPPAGLGELPGDVRVYIEWGLRSGAASVAVRAFGERWYSHVYRQVASKRPFATLFLPDKIDARFRNRGVFAVAPEIPVSATKNFYLVLDRQCSPLLTLWFNSGLFILLLLHAGRMISRTWTRFLEDDYLKLPIPNPTICREYEGEAGNMIREISSTRLPPLSLQISNPYRRKLDEFIFDVLGAQGTNVDYVHDLLAKTLEELKTHERRATYGETS
jgi:hypothetical protein